jgi:ribosomal protein S18 acetylase RimI-like enzyme
MQPAPAVRPAKADEHEAALRLLFRDIPADEREHRIASALDLIRTGELDPTGLFVERNASGLAGVVICLPVPGASALFWPPRSVHDSDSGAREDRLLRMAVHWVRQRGAKLSQALLTPEEVPTAVSLERNGFRHVTRLWYLATDHSLESAKGELEFEPYASGRSDLFNETLLQTYEGTLDCPEISGVRSIEEVIAGHQAQGQFNPASWWLVLHVGRPAGVLLMTATAQGAGWDVSYVGIVPEARRRGFGRQTMLKALHEANQAGAKRVTLSVDARNGPALHLYRELGFAPYDCREVYLAIWR